jgi:tRNA (cytosine38-C5)-methyltransferase
MKHHAHMQFQIESYSNMVDSLTLFFPRPSGHAVLPEVGQALYCTTVCSHLFLTGYTKLVERAGSILQMNESLDVSLIFLTCFYSLTDERIQTTETFDKFMEVSNDLQSVQMLHSLGLRYFSPTELLRISDLVPLHSQYSFNWPKGVSTKTKYRLIGNSVNVTVVKELLQYLFYE